MGEPVRLDEPTVDRALEVFPPLRPGRPAREEERRVTAGTTEGRQGLTDVARQVVVEGDGDREALSTPSRPRHLEDHPRRHDAVVAPEVAEVLREGVGRDGRVDLQLGISTDRADTVIDEDDAGLAGRGTSAPAKRRSGGDPYPLADDRHRPNSRRP